MIRAILALPPQVDANFLAMISQLSEGNPFFIEEILRSLITEGEIFSTHGVGNPWVSCIFPAACR